MLTYDPKARITIEQVIEHEFLRKHSISMKGTLLEQRFETLNVDKENTDRNNYECPVEETPAFREQMG